MPWEDREEVVYDDKTAEIKTLLWQNEWYFTMETLLTKILQLGPIYEGKVSIRIIWWKYACLL